MTHSVQEEYRLQRLRRRDKWNILPIKPRYYSETVGICGDMHKSNEYGNFYSFTFGGSYENNLTKTHVHYYKNFQHEICCAKVT